MASQHFKSTGLSAELDPDVGKMKWSQRTLALAQKQSCFSMKIATLI